jgi:hypothetical protein
MAQHERQLPAAPQMTATQSTQKRWYRARGQHRSPDTRARAHGQKCHQHMIAGHQYRLSARRLAHSLVPVSVHVPRDVQVQAPARTRAATSPEWRLREGTRIGNEASRQGSNHDKHRCNIVASTSLSSTPQVRCELKAASAKPKSALRDQRWRATYARVRVQKNGCCLH